MTAAPVLPTQRIPAVDALRGIAILLILLRHLEWQEEHFYGGFGDLIFTLIESAWCGVDLFFVLSGFLITGILFDTKNSQSYFRTFYLRRVIRIIPLYYGFLAISVLLLPALRPGDAQLQHLAAQQAWLWSFGTNLLIGWQREWTFMTDTISLGHFWTLAVEEHFYLIWPLIVLHLKRRTVMAVCLAAMGAALASRLWFFAHGANDVPGFVLTWCRLDSLTTGAFLALAVRGPRGLAALRTPAWFTFLATGSILILLLLTQGNHLDFHRMATMTYGFTILAWFFGALLILAAGVRPDTLGARIWSSSILKFFSKYSYGLFAFQAIPKRFYHALFPLDRMTAFFGSYRTALGVYSLLLLGTMILLAMLSWHLYEKQFLKLKRHLPYVYAALPPAKPVATDPRSAGMPT